MENRPLVALLTNDLVGSYQYNFWAGMKSAAAKEDCDLVSFCGGRVSSRDLDLRMRNSCFEIVPDARPDVVVVLASLFDWSGGAKTVGAFLDRFAGIPILTVGFKSEGHPFLMIDNQAGMRDLVEHLVAEHGLARFCFLGGGSGSPDSQQRLQALEDVLASHRLSLRPELVLDAGYDFGSAHRQITGLLDSGQVFDAVVAANDNMAMGAMEALRERGKRVPDDVVVTGFDNIEDGRWVPFGLTTVDQSLQEQGAEAVRIVLDLLERGASRETRGIASRMVVRGSCGCSSPSMIAARRLCPLGGPVDPSEGGLGSARHVDAVLGECASVLPEKRFASYLRDLLDAMANDSRTGGHGATLHRFHFLHEMASVPEEGFDRWQILVSNIRGASLPFLPDDRRVVANFESLVHQLRIEIHERSLQQMGAATIQSHRWARDVHEVGHRLTGCTEVPQVVEILASEARNLKIASLHLLLRDPDASSMVHRLHLSIQGGDRRRLPEGGLVQSPEEFFRSVVRSRVLRSAMVAMPLYFAETQLGFAFLELVSRRGMLLDSVRALISASIIGTRLGESLSGGSASDAPFPHPTSRG